MKKIIFTATLFLCVAQLPAQSYRETARVINKMSQFLGYLGNSYVDTIDMTATVDRAIEDVLAGLDPHSTYVTAEEMVGVREEFSANFEGIGIEFRVFRDTVMVAGTISGGPSEKVGLLPDDRIVKVDGASIIGVKDTEVPRLLKGPKGSVVEISVVRRGVNGEMLFNITRDRIPIHTLDAAYKVDDATGYVRLNRFAATTDSELQEAMDRMGAIDALILDLRGNGGGFLDQAVAVSGNFLRQGALVVSMEGRSVPPEKMYATGTPRFPRGRLIVLVDEFSASASEIVAGAVQDWDRGLIVGRRSFGKGLVQSQYPLLDGSAVRITVARYHTPSGRVIQTPYEKGAVDEYYKNFNDRFVVLDSMTVSAPRPDSAPAADATVFHTLVAGRKIYGGGGITPDVVVPADTTALSEYWGRLSRSGTIIEYVTDYIDLNRNSLSARYPDFDAYKDGFAASDMIEGLVALGESKGVVRDNSGLERSRRQLEVQLKALLAQRLWGTTEYYRIMNTEADETYARALEVLKNWPEYASQLE